MKYKIAIIIIIIAFRMENGTTQNLIVNGDFEQINVCSEYNEKCSPVGWRSTSEKLFGFVQKSNNNYIKLLLYNERNANQRKFAQTELLCPLEKGELYEISMKIKANIFGIKSICVGFSDSFQYNKNLDFSLKYLNKKCLDITEAVKKDEWVDVKFQYESHGFEKFICIGNLNEDNNTVVQILDKKEYKKLQKSYLPQGLIEYGIDDIVIQNVNRTKCDDMEYREKSILLNKNRHTPIWNTDIRARKDSHIVSEIDENVLQEKIQNVTKKTELRIKKEIVLNDLSFENNKYKLTSSNIDQLNTVVQEMLKNDFMKIKISGHTDSTGNRHYNKALSLKRAESVKDYLAKKGINKKRMQTEGKGQSEPLVEEKDEESRRINRRVVIEIL